MKKALFFVLLSTVGICSSVQAQKFGYVDTEYILGKMPEYQKALGEIDKFADKWSKDIQDKYVEIEKLQKSYQAEEILLTEDMKRDRQRAISEKELEARAYNNKVFGYQGLLYDKKKELMKTPMDLIYRALDKVCAQKKLDFIFDKASDFVMLYTNPRHDYSDYVMEELGIDTKPTATNSNPTNKTTAKPK